MTFAYETTESLISSIKTLKAQYKKASRAYDKACESEDISDATLEKMDEEVGKLSNLIEDAQNELYFQKENPNFANED